MYRTPEMEKTMRDLYGLISFLLMAAGILLIAASFDDSANIFSTNMKQLKLLALGPQCFLAGFLGMGLSMRG